MTNIFIIAAVVVFGIGFIGWASANEVNWIGIVVHHSASDSDNFEIIDRYHRSKGWDGCGYHFVIEKDGTIKEGRPLRKHGAHAKNRNRTHIGICLVGTNEFTLIQKVSLTNLCRALNRSYPIQSIERHHEKCPGDGLQIEVLERTVLNK